jgi:DNA-binding NtrC family response regulator
MSIRILVIDDDAVACEFLQEALSREGYEIQTRTSARTALEEDLSQYDLLLADIRMPDMDGLQFLRAVHESLPQMPVIMMTAFGSLETTMEALRLGAWDYISKPFSPDAIRGMVRKVLEVRSLHQLRMQGEPKAETESHFIGSSATMVNFYKQLARVADASASILIEGESGTGKELTARSLHQFSSRRDRPFIPVHCGAIPDTLLESELFGYERGAFTGADHAHPGLLESAKDGTIFLDEITEMSPALQGKLLRFMQNGEIRPGGGGGKPGHRRGGAERTLPGGPPVPVRCPPPHPAPPETQGGHSPAGEVPAEQNRAPDRPGIRRGHGAVHGLRLAGKRA